MPKVISVFDDHDSARRAVDHLVEAGFPRGAVHIGRGGEADLFSPGTAPMPWSAQQHEHQGVLSSIGHALASVVGMDTPDPETQEFLEGMRRGHCAVVVERADEAQAQRAKQIMGDLGAVDIKERERAERALAADQGDSERTRGLDGPTGGRGDRPDDTR